MWAIIAGIGSFFPGLLGKEIGFKAAKVLGVMMLVILIVAILSIGKCAYDRSIIDAHDAAREAAAGQAREDAADQRVKDAITNAKNEEELHDVINAAPGGTLSPAARALACERLRRLGRIPPACGPSGGDGEQTGSP